MDKHRRADLRAVGEERDQAQIVQISRADVVANLHAHVAGHHRTLDLQARSVDILQWNLPRERSTRSHE